MAGELDRIAAEMQMQQSKGEAIRQQMQQMQSTMLEIGSAMDTVQNLKKAKGETLVPIGAGLYISCAKPNPELVVVNVGANVLVQKKPDEALAILEERQKKVTDAISEAQEGLSEVVKELDRLSQRANSIAAAEEKNVRPSQE